MEHSHKKNTKKLHIAISGLIGVGKTTLAKQLSEVLDVPVYVRVDRITIKFANQSFSTNRWRITNI